MRIEELAALQESAGLAHGGFHDPDLQSYCHDMDKTGNHVFDSEISRLIVKQMVQREGRDLEYAQAQFEYLEDRRRRYCPDKPHYNGPRKLRYFTKYHDGPYKGCNGDDDDNESEEDNLQGPARFAEVMELLCDVMMGHNAQEYLDDGEYYSHSDDDYEVGCEGPPQRLRERRRSPSKRKYCVLAKIKSGSGVRTNDDGDIPIIVSEGRRGHMKRKETLRQAQKRHDTEWIN